MGSTWQAPFCHFLIGEREGSVREQGPGGVEPATRSQALCSDVLRSVLRVLPTPAHLSPPCSAHQDEADLYVLHQG